MGTKMRVDAVNKYVEGAEPSSTSLTFPGLTIEDHQALHRALMQGAGFYNWMAATPAQPTLPKLPVIDFLDIEDKVYADCIIQEALEEDRQRFRHYMSHRTLGLGMISGAAGTGKTTALAAATLAMESKLGPILCLAPTDVAVTNFAVRISRVSATVTERRNKAAEGERVHQKKLVVRGNKTAHEISALWSLLEKSDDVEGVATRLDLSLSLAFWVLVILRHKVGGDLDEYGPKAIHDLRTSVDQRENLAGLRGVANGTVDFKELRKDEDELKQRLKALMLEIVNRADFLCVTPAGSEGPDYIAWKEVLARGIAVDEAANMNRGDLACGWGNVCRPMFLAGDAKS
jgi:hypothetical protein